MAQRTTLSQERPMQTAKEGDQERNRIFDAFRRWGYLEARLDPLGIFEPLKHPDLEGLSGELAEEARRIYCGTIGADFMHLAEPERRRGSFDSLNDPAAADSRRPFRTGPASAVSRFEAIFSGRRHGTYSLARCHLERGRGTRRGVFHHGHESSWPPERHGARRVQEPA